MNTSVIIPAFNAATTLDRSVQSLLAQTQSNWEAIIINDGSTDNTAEVATQFSIKDSRIRVLTQPNQGVSVARNTGIAAARYDWLLFLDADDWIAPHFLERIYQPLSQDASFDLIHCQWSWVAADGTRHDYPLPTLKDMFPQTARGCPLAVHGCVVRKVVVEAVGGFDPSLQTCEDWDLWQKLARMGIQTEGVPEVMAFYHMRAGSLSNQADQMLKDGLVVIERGYSCDQRIPDPIPDYCNGLPPVDLYEVKLGYIASVAALLVGVNQDACRILAAIESQTLPSLDPHAIAYAFFESTPLPTCQSTKQLYSLWTSRQSLINRFLEALAAKVQIPQLAEQVNQELIELILEHADLPLPVAEAGIFVDQIEITTPIKDICLPPSTQQFFAIVTWNGDRIGVVKLPSCDGKVSAWVLVDAIAAQWFWIILGRYFEQTIYSQRNDFKVLRDSQSLPSIHSQKGWETFLQEFWGCPKWAEADFYRSTSSQKQAPQQLAESGWITIELSQPLPRVTFNTRELRISLTLAGVGIGVISLPAPSANKTTILSAQDLRVAITTEGGLELCRGAVREALVGHQPPQSLRVALQAKAQKTAELTDMDSSILRLGYRFDPLGTSASRRAQLPIATHAAVLELLATTHEAYYPTDLNSQAITQIVYDPGWVDRQISQRTARTTVSQQRPVLSTQQYDRTFFEKLFASQPNPWKYTSNYEQIKYQQTLSLLPAQPIPKALELACAEGHFTRQLAPLVNVLVAADISQVALDQAAKRCQEFEHIRYYQLDLAKDPIPEQYHLIVCSEVLYYVGQIADLRQVALKLANALEPDGYLLMAHGHVWTEDPDQPGFDWNVPFGAKTINTVFSRQGQFKLVKEIVTPIYRIQLFQRKPRFQWNGFRSPYRITYLQQPTPLPPNVENQIIWGHAQEQLDEVDLTDPDTSHFTHQLPILMYHHIADQGSDSLQQWRLSPHMFEIQLKYLYDLGYYSISLDQWSHSLRTNQPLPGKAVAITFDDGYKTFFTHAWPLLQRYGFTATVFLVASRVGHVNDWDDHYGDPLPLMDWDQIGELQQAGVYFGSHSFTHRSLTRCTPAEMIEEGARSRARLEEQLNQPIKSIAYPYGQVNSMVAHLMGACGYTIGVTCHEGLSQLNNPALLLPRQEITGLDRLREFMTKLDP